ncbi:MAG: helix-turn-helix domain-containing protein [Prosthecobacter sp.]
MARRYRNILGPNIRKLRQQAGLTQDDLAARLQLAGLDNIDRVAVAKIESQIRSLYDFETIILARVLKVTCETLMDVPHQRLKGALPALSKGEI